MYQPNVNTRLSVEQLNRFEETDLEGVLPSLNLLIENLARFDGQFDTAIGHLNRAARSVYKVAISS